MGLAWTPRLARSTLIIMLASFLGLAAFQLVAGHYLYADGFREAEQRDLLARARHAQALMEQGFQPLKSTAIDYGDWDHSYEFILGDRPDYPQTNWTIETLQRFKSDLAFMVDIDGGVALEVAVSPGGDSLVVPTVAERNAVLPGSQIWAQREVSDSKQGYVVIADMPHQWVAAPVHPSGQSIPIAGWIVMMRRLGSGFEGELEQTLSAHAGFEVAPQTAAIHEPPSIPLRLDELQMGAPSYDTIDASFAISALGPGSVLRLRLTTDRYLMSRMAAISIYFYLASFAVGGLIAAFAMLWVRRRLLVPLGQISNRLRTMGEDLDLSVRLPMLGKRDEITGVTIAANRLLARIASIHDVENARDAALAASRSKSQFLARMSHEIRTPMNGVLGMTELLAGTTLDRRQRQYAETIQHSAEALLGIINDILDFSKIEAGKMVLEDAPFDLRQTVEEAVELLLESAHAKGLKLVCELSPELYALYRGDGRRLRQVLVNLLGNAVKFTEHGQVSMRVRALDGGDEDRTIVRFEVEDTGIGIPPESQATVFESFAQADASTTRRYGGTGLGLPISDQLVGLLGGKLEVQSTAGAGSIFSFTLSFVRESAIPTKTHSEPALGTRAGAVRLGLTVLLVEDNLVNQIVAKAMLERLGCEVVMADEGAEGVQLYQTRRFDVVLMDCQMRILDGFGATAQIRAHERSANQARTPIVALTANALDGERDKCLAAGMDAYLSKPYTQIQLQQVLEQSTRQTPQDAVHGSIEEAVALPEAANAVLDRRALEDLRKLRRPGGADPLARLIPIYLKTSAELIAQIRSAQAQGDRQGMRVAAHTLKPSSAFVGAISLADVAGQLEALCVDGDAGLVRAEPLVDRLRELHAQVIAELRNVDTDSAAAER